MPQASTHSILVVEDDRTLNQLLVKALEQAGYEVTSVHNWAQAQQAIQNVAPDLVLLDIDLPDSSNFDPLRETAPFRPVVVLTAYGSVNQAVEAMRLGAANYLIKPVNLDELELVIRRSLESNHLYAQKALRAQDTLPDSQLGMVGESPAIEKLRATIREVAASNLTVLIQGESGAGKELVARALHTSSPRAAENFAPIDCCTLQENLFESELFGYERGAFTGAEKRKPGLIEAANQGTLFLDEIGELTIALQAKLLRVLETGRFRRVGSTSDLRADIRVITATNRDLLAFSQSGRFRSDLYYRLSTFIIYVPPLRERVSDIPLLASHFMHKRRQSQGLPPLPFADAAMRRLMQYNWPGNIRELSNVIERAIIVAGESSHIEIEHLQPLTPRPLYPPAPEHSNYNPQPPMPAISFNAVTEQLIVHGQPTLKQIEREYLAALLKHHDGNRRKVANALGVAERTAYRMMEKHGYK